MGNISSSGRRRHRRRHHHHHPPPPPPPPHDAVYVGSSGRLQNPNLVDGHGVVEHDKAVTIRNDANIKKETLRMEPDLLNPPHFLLAFTFDATAPGCITVMYFAKETLDGKLIPVKESVLKQISMPFQQGLCQKFRQPSGTGIEFSQLEETGVTKEGDIEVYPLVLKAETRPSNHYENDGNLSSQITLASFEKREPGGYKVQVVKQVLWVNGKRYELQEIYGIGNANDGDFDGHDSGGECVICLSEPRDITVLPCRHMCMCSGCANLLKVHTAKCPICRHPVERLLEIKVNNEPANQ
ncbi:hypothetical protein TanjilG_04304 [Lupinus angustifolius]|uniref:RING-type E3 ubiquitin transferase n=1 Tax=Lupinus angustifolius TaxID=3871 RepID=A0A4P1RQI3_LUPAN|nr:PREDICTED: probable E3 ubiquitin-protein ligase LUL2 [Lupinus angustifolius]OIW15769.1 hypothetical protein TanjilG_04304 [Lupinus angustifolius]